MLAPQMDVPAANSNPEPAVGRDASPERLTGRDGRDLIGWILAGLVGVLVASRFFFAAFPEAAMDFRITPEEARGIAGVFAQQYVDSVGADSIRLSKYEQTKAFRIEEDGNGGGPKVYLEREVGLEEANKLMAGDVSVWFWEVRFFQPRQQEEFRVQVSPAGRIVGYFHTVEEARAGARLEQVPAQAIAEEFARKRAKAPLDNYDFLPEEANSTERPNRRDWKFTWERRGFKAKDAPYRIEVTLQGDRVGSYREFLKVPETWTRDFARLRSSNLFYQLAAQVPYMFLMGAVLLTVFELAKKGLAPWGGSLRLGLVLATLFFLMSVNQWPLTRAGYDTNSSYSGFVMSQMTSAALLSLVLGMMVAFSVAAGEPIYRLLKPESLQLGALFRRATWLDTLRSKEFFKATVIGLSLAAAHIGFVVAFYLAGRSAGFWSPQEVKYTDAVNTLAPWLFPLAISLFAATSEEFLFRLFAIPLLLKLTKSKAIAIIVPAFIWGFLHSAYPQQPGFVRGIEVGLIGIVAGWVMLRWGILATLVWHYTVDALLIGLFLLRSENWYFKVSGTVVVALTVFPLVAAVGLFAVHRRFSVNASLLNQALPLTPKVEEVAVQAAPVATTSGYEGLSKSARMWLPVAGAIGVLLLVMPRPEAIGNFVRYSITATEAGERADQILRKRKVDPASFYRVTTVVNNFPGDTLEFLRRELGPSGTNQVYRERVPGAFWRTRYFRDSEKEEFQVVLLPDGQFHALHHPLDERTEGANLIKEEAVARAEAWLREYKGVDFAKWKLVEEKSEKKPKRTDHTLVWEELEPVNSQSKPVEKDRAAHVRVEIKVQGDEVSGYRKFVKLPEEWLRQHTEDTLPRTAYTVGRIAVFAGVAVWMLVIFFTNLRKQAVPWGRISRWALWAALAIGINVANSLPIVLGTYTTEFPMKIFFAVTVFGIFFSLAIVYGGVFLALAFAWFFLARAFGEARMPGWRGMPREYYRDALLIAASGASGLMVLFGRVPVWADQILPTWKQFVGVPVPDGLDSYFPAAGEMAGAVMVGLGLTGVLGLCAGFFAQWKGNRAVQGMFFLLTALVLAGTPANGPDFAKHLLLSSFQLAVVWFFVTQVIRFNLMGCFLLTAAVALIAGAIELFRQPVFFYRLNGGICVAGLAMLFGFGVLLSRSAVTAAGEGPAAGTPLPTN